jgi:hypothetical protein
LEQILQKGIGLNRRFGITGIIGGGRLRAYSLKQRTFYCTVRVEIGVTF